MRTQVVDIIVERRGCILLLKKGDFWILPGTEVDPGECERERLNDLISREVGDTVDCVFRKLDKKIIGSSPVRHCEVEVTVYVGELSNKRMSDIKDLNVHWFSRGSIPSLRLSNITTSVLAQYFSEETKAREG
jgi:ADP-ribose pyrophosphatase YjhB (NUDIX family)